MRRIVLSLHINLTSLLYLFFQSTVLSPFFLNFFDIFYFFMFLSFLLLLIKSWFRIQDRGHMYLGLISLPCKKDQRQEKWGGTVLIFPRNVPSALCSFQADIQNMGQRDLYICQSALPSHSDARAGSLPMVSALVLVVWQWEIWILFSSVYWFLCSIQPISQPHLCTPSNTAASLATSHGTTSWHTHSPSLASQMLLLIMALWREDQKARERREERMNMSYHAFRHQRSINKTNKQKNNKIIKFDYWLF